MNLESDFKPFCDALDALWAIKGQSLSAAARQAFFNALEQYPLREVEAGLEAHSRDPERGRFLPMPADVIAQINAIVASDGRPGAEEAWAIAARARDESETVVWTRETAEALGIARSILDMGDEVGARMAFKDAYNRLVDAARARREPASWDVSLGFDPKRRDVAIIAAVGAGRLPQTALPSPVGEAPLLLSLDAVPNMPGHIREELKRLSEQLRADLDKPSRDAAARAETLAKQAEAAARVQAYAESHGIAMQPQGVSE